MATRRARRSITTFAILILLSVTLLALDNQASSTLTSSARAVGRTLLSPVVSVIDAVTRPIGSFFAGAVNYGSVSAENARLQALVGQLESQRGRRSFENAQLAEITALQHLAFLPSLPTVTCQTTALEVSNFAATIDINKGRDEGIALGMPVVGSGGLVGQVVQTTRSSATVRLVTDGASKVGAVFGGSNLLGIANGVAAGKPLSIDYVPPASPVQLGEMLFTNGLQGAQFPPGIPIGRVTQKSSPVNASQMTISVVPAANLQHLGFVDVVLWEPAP